MTDGGPRTAAAAPAPTPRVTVLTPVYNGERHIAECIESVLAQTYSEFDYLIADNCSTDRTVAIARGYAERDARVRVLTHADFLDVIGSHNRALALAPAENPYIKLVCADDWLFPDCIHSLVEVAENHPTVGMVTSYVLRDRHVGWDGLPYPSTFVRGRDICRMRLLDRILVFGGPTASLLRTEAVRQFVPFYTPGNPHGDNDAYLRMLQHYDFGFVHQVLSFNRGGAESGTSHRLDAMNTFALMVIEELVHFGPTYLTDAELKSRLAGTLDEYYRFLGRSVFDFRGREFWDLHRARLAKVGLPLDRARLARRVAAHAFDLALNPKRTLENLLGRIAERQD